MAWFVSGDGSARVGPYDKDAAKKVAAQLKGGKVHKNAHGTDKPKGGKHAK